MLFHERMEQWIFINGSKDKGVLVRFKDCLIQDRG